jgi:hypothetical protein
MIQFPLEIHGMVRACRPITPYVGLCRQSRDPAKTKDYYEEARKIRDLVCFPSMLKEATQRCLGYRALRRLWIQTLYTYLQIPFYKYPLIRRILEYLSVEQPERIPPFYNKHHWILDYPSLSHTIRMEQLAGKLHALGYTRMILPDLDEELEGYRVLAKDKYFHHAIDVIPDLYQELKRKKIVNKWHILSSRIRQRNMELSYDKEQWIRFCQQNKLILYVNACIRENRLSSEESQLLIHWANVMKYPNR